MTDIIDRLQRIADLKLGDMFPEDFCDGDYNWGPPLTRLLKDAIKEIRYLRNVHMVDHE